jgi:hypothetical protein
MTISTAFAAVRNIGLAFSLLALLASCKADKPLPPCPSVRVDATTGTMTKFRDGGGHALEDVEYEVRLLGYKGICDFKDKGVDVSFDLTMEIASGPAAKPGSTPIYYFIALPQFWPEATGKRIMTINHDLKAGAGRTARINQNSQHVFIPLGEKEPAAAYDVYVGLQLTPDQLEYNRSIQQGRR